MFIESKQTQIGLGCFPSPIHKELLSPYAASALRPTLIALLGQRNAIQHGNISLNLFGIAHAIRCSRNERKQHHSHGDRRTFARNVACGWYGARTSAIAVRQVAATRAA